MVTGTRITITVNGEAQEVPEGSTVSGLLGLRGLQETRGLAVAVADQLVRRDQWALHRLQTGDVVLLVSAARGG